MEENKQVAKVESHPIKALFSKDEVKKRFSEIMDKKAPAFISSVLTLVNQNKNLAIAEPQSVLQAAAIAATLDLPINQNLGFAFIVPYRNNKTGDTLAQFQLGYKGFIQLAMRTGQYKTINACEVYEGEIKKHNKFTGEFEFGEKTSSKVVGYMAYFKLVNGFEKYSFMTIEKVQAHAEQYSKAFAAGYGMWKDEFDSMALKTVLKLLLSKYGILSTDMRTAIESDQKVMDKDGSYLDNAKRDSDEDIKDPEEKTEGPKKEEPKKDEIKGPENTNMASIVGHIMSVTEPPAGGLFYEFAIAEAPHTPFSINKKEKDTVEFLQTAMNTQAKVEITYETVEKGRRISRYIKSVKEVLEK